MTSPIISFNKHTKLAFLSSTFEHKCGVKQPQNQTGRTRKAKRVGFQNNQYANNKSVFNF